MPIWASHRDPVGQEHTELYLRANDAYEAARWQQVGLLMEDALEGFLEAERRCRTLCERFFPQGFNPDFVANVASEYLHVMGHLTDAYIQGC